MCGLSIVRFARLFKEEDLTRRKQEVRAMRCLRGVSEELYQAAAVPRRDRDLPPPLRLPVDTPPIPGYKPGMNIAELPNQPQPMTRIEADTDKTAAPATA